MQSILKFIYFVFNATFNLLLQVLSLIEICSKSVAKNHAFETIELYSPPIPDALQLRIAYHSFPENEEEIRLYSCLASGSNEKFKQGENLAKSGNVHDVLQIGMILIFIYFLKHTNFVYDCH